MNTTLALLPPPGIIQDNITIPALTLPTSTPTPILLKRVSGIDIHLPVFPTSTPVAPTATPATPTNTSAPMPSDTVLSGTPEVRESATPTAMVSVSSTPTGTPPKPQNRNMTETFLWIALIVLVLVILRSNWDKIKAGFGKKEE